MFGVECFGGPLAVDQSWGLYTDREFETEDEAQEFIEEEIRWDKENLTGYDPAPEYSYRIIPLSVGWND